jgi:uncharacterized protein (TIGR02145 family)
VRIEACNDLVTSTSAKPFKLKGGLPLNGTYSGPGVAAGFFDPAAAGPGLHQVTYAYTNIVGCAASAIRIIDVRNAAPFLCGSVLTDIRDNHAYPTVQIGTQCWMAANLDFGSLRSSSEPQVDNCINEKYCGGDVPANCTQNGGLYEWDELMRYEVVPGSQGLCPAGWHVPTDAEWATLLNFYGGQQHAGTFIKNAGAADFHAIPAGVIYQNNTWTHNGPSMQASIFWSSDPVGPLKAMSHGLNSEVGSVSDYLSDRGNALSVRCLLDSP